MAMSLLDQIGEQLESLNKSERKVAEVILQDPKSATRMSISTLANASLVSEPTVNRFCRNFETSGFPDFKIQLAQSLATGTPYVSRDVEQDDNTEEYTDKIFTSTIAAMENARKHVNLMAIEKAVDILIQAKQIAFFGLGASGPVAMDAQHKFFRFNLPVMAYDDVMMMRMVAAAAHTGDVIVAISYTGRTRDMVDIARIARSNGASVIGLTADQSPLAASSSVHLSFPTPEDTDKYMPMTSRIVQLVLLDVLATGVTLRRGVDFHAHLKKIKDSLKATRYPDLPTQP
ncbi:MULTISPECIES: transcriptional regulator HexR [unclassified Oceanobacter]|uniref:transcriptional regulator HexR n=1 Tax=unclassified Oceanobacter TaxID=2620260 RepID=UPI0026E3D972|nr:MULTISPECIES: transcriptional regulator HexR [unclassified Oceanobacter]MDO6682017.1 transcriptional regulator HexR [Oceanobacter sp. 5_MG-2023]MDP2505430.1 transcriptional regulator HexR [Oceanobacter sp. 3_MG-2023]MDP2548053.1 transcriptional regulator HexR [Oceanobacter sp. 4_MG-2023]MDP2610093.1 transcriptional regulator HexR [Oceanobacter sp. 1_MG-2023]MDP2612332.1 transcriptional regulator HexR [Oceanobacter sp. 2_MG-2023]